MLSSGGEFVSPGHPSRSPVLPGAREGEVERLVSRRAAWIEEPNKTGFPGGDLNFN